MRLLPVLLFVACGPPDYGSKTGTDDTDVPVNDVDGDGFSIAEGDCDDEDERSFPGATDITGDAVDQNCDGADGVDADGDGHPWEGAGGDDCDDADRDTYTGAVEVGWDGIDQDCDGRDRYDFQEVTGGFAHTCGLDSRGVIRCWGSDDFGQVGNRPIDEGWKHVSSGRNFSCAVHTDGRLACWGEDLSHQIRDMPTTVGWDVVSCGNEFACALTPAGEAACWGLDDFGQVANTPTAVDFSAIGAGGSHGCGVTKDDGVILCWGDDSENQISFKPFLENNIAITSGTDHSCSIRQDLGLDCWGSNVFYQGSAPSDAGPWSMLSATSNTTCGIMEGQTLVCWGYNVNGEVSDAPVNTEAHWVGMGVNHGCAIKNADDEVICWGRDFDGQATVPAWQ